MLAEFAPQIAVEFGDCADAADFLRIVTTITSERRASREGLILHIEAHGDVEEGSNFANDGQLSWVKVAEILLDLNAATRFNLVEVLQHVVAHSLLETSRIANQLNVLAS